MRAVRCTERGIEVVEVAAPTGDAVRVRVRSAGICGSDVSLVEGGPVAVTLGHEIAGVLDDGTAVAIEPIVPCGACETCATGNQHLCDQAIVSVMGVGTDGGMCDELLVPERCLVPLPAEVAPADGCLVEPLAVAVHALRIADARPGAEVAVIGAGAIGLCAVVAAETLGCSVSVAARYDTQREAASRLGATGDAARCDVAVVAAASDHAVHEAVARCRPGGTVVIVATFWDKIGVPGLTAMTKELRIVPTFAYGHHRGRRDIDVAAATLATRPVVAETLITHRFALDDAAEAFRVATDRASGAIKVALVP